LNLEELGWGEPFASAFAASDPDGGTPARVVAVHRGRLVVAGPQGESFAVVAGRVPEHPTVGDWVVVDDHGVVNARLPRRGVLARPGQELAANVDVAFVVTSANRDLNARRL
jgi:ribosome biogenesis GTPase / thiamine phosphate phosphatase